MKTLAISVVVVSAALAACSSPRAPSPAAPEAQPRAAQAAAAATATATAIYGDATYLERVKMPPGAVMQVELIDAATQRVLATTEVRDVGGPPIPFSIAMPARSTETGVALRATLNGPDGERWFETPAPVAASIDGGGVKLLMRRAAAPTSNATTTAGTTTHWECGELGVMSRFDARANTVRLDFNGQRLTLPLARSASGARYADASNEFWTKGATGTLTLAGEAARDCVQAAQASPWNEAALRGAAFRAVGSEPGWSVDIAGDPPRLAGLLDYGERKVDAPVRPDAEGWSSVDGKAPVRLRAERRECRDGMSGQAFEATVMLDVAGRRYAGCGAWLQD